MLQIKQREIWLVNFDPTVGQEIQKKRPAIVINDTALGILPLAMVVPITSWDDKYENYPWFVQIESDAKNKLEKASAADTFQTKSISTKRMIYKIGEISEETLKEIQEGLLLILGL